jgi:Fic family protein
MRPLKTREARSSTEIEGTHVTDDEMIGMAARLPGPPSGSMTEFRNLLNALEQAEEASGEPLSLNLLLRLHKTLMTGVRGGDKTPGQLRDCSVRVGGLLEGTPRFLPPPHTNVPGLLDSFFKYASNPLRNPIDPLVDAFLCHYQFETIHPFRDGNGRLGRLLLSMMVKNWLGHDHVWLYMSPYFNDNKSEYEDRLFRVSANGEWTEWVEFCLRGARDRARDAFARCQLLVNLQRDYMQRIAILDDGSQRLTRMVDFLFRVRPLIYTEDAKDMGGKSDSTARNDIAKLVRAGILQQWGSTRPRRYLATEIWRATI